MMHPIKFPGSNMTWAKDQPPYIPLPTFGIKESPSFPIISCWKMRWRDRLRVLFTGKIWVGLLTYHKPLTPIRVDVINWMEDEIEKSKVK